MQNEDGDKLKNIEYVEAYITYYNQIIPRVAGGWLTMEEAQVLLEDYRQKLDAELRSKH